MTTITITLKESADVGRIATAYNTTSKDVPGRLSEHAQQLADAIKDQDTGLSIAGATLEQFERLRPDLVQSVARKIAETR